MIARGRPRPDPIKPLRKNVGDYTIFGNGHVAIATHMENPKDAHGFAPGRADPNDELTFMTAWERAEVWASPGE